MSVFMQTDFKISKIVQNKYEKVVSLNIYEGDIITQKEETVNGIKNTTCYRRINQLKSLDFIISLDSSEDDILLLGKQELAKDKTRMSIPEQNL